LLEMALPTTKPRARMSDSARNVMRAFRTVYADALITDFSEAEWAKVARKRRLTWQSEQRLSLADAFRCYNQMADTYNEFRPSLLRRLLKAFPDDGIEVTAAREYSVAVYLHVPDVGDLRERVHRFADERLKADVVAWTEPGVLRCWWD